MRRAAALSRALPNQAVSDYIALAEEELNNLPDSIVSTEVERMVRQRVGQNKYRSAMLDYWGDACAVTGVRITELLRGSHALPWSACQSDAERLDVFNGFASLDALFYSFLISFDSKGQVLFEPHINIHQLALLGITPPYMRLRWIDDKHEAYLAQHKLPTNYQQLIHRNRVEVTIYSVAEMFKARYLVF